jgi:hypothetical protein
VCDTFFGCAFTVFFGCAFFVTTFLWCFEVGTETGEGAGELCPDCAGLEVDVDEELELPVVLLFVELPVVPVLDEPPLLPVVPVLDEPPLLPVVPVLDEPPLLPVVPVLDEPLPLGSPLLGRR